MAAELGLLSLTQLQKLAQQQKIEDLEAEAGRSTSSNNINNNYWMWNPKQQVSQDEEEDESWEVKAFEQDTGNNITWPPRSYTCTFCRREFRSAQALGGHMNVHRRDRARLHHQTVPTPAATAVSSSSSSSSSSTTTTTLLIPAQEFGGGLCLLYSLPNPKGVTGVNSCMDSPSTTTLLSISPFEPNNLVPSFPPPPPPPTTTYPNYLVTPRSINSSSNCHESSNTEPSASNISNDNREFKLKDSNNEELDLELRLGRR